MSGRRIDWHTAVSSDAWRTRSDGWIARHVGCCVSSVTRARLVHKFPASPGERSVSRGTVPVVTAWQPTSMVMTDSVRVHGVLAAIRDLPADSRAQLKRLLSTVEW